MRKRGINRFLVWLSAFLYFYPSMCWLTSIIGHAISPRPIPNSLWGVQAIFAAIYAALIALLARERNSVQQALKPQSLSPLFQDRRIMWLTLASIVSLLSVMGKAITHQPSWLAVSVYSVLLPSVWLVSGLIMTAAAKTIDQDQAMPSL